MKVAIGLALVAWTCLGAPEPANERANVSRIRDRIVGRSPRAARKPQPYKVTIPNTTISYSMVPIRAGEFLMGSGEKDEQPRHKVRVDAFWMQAHEVTWDEYLLFMFASQGGEISHKDEVVDAVSRPTLPYVEMSFGMGLNGFPAISMTQHAANKYAEWLSARTGEFYRLPTEAEWEYACRAGAADPSKLGDYAWFSDNSRGKYHEVATKTPNAWGLYDMLGNVMEWTLDQYAPYQTGARVNPWIAATKPYPHAVRGGSWNDPADRLRCSARVASDPSWKQQDPQLPKSIWYHTDAQWLGFRLVRPSKVPSAEQMYRYWNSGLEHEYAPAADLRRFEAVEPGMGTLVRIELYTSGEQRAAAAFRAAFDRIAQLDALLSDYRPDSELNRICRTAAGRPVQVSSDLFHVLAASQKLARETGGAFDVTLGPVIRLWRQARKEKRLPDPAALREALKRCGYQKLHLDPASQAVTLDEAGMVLDLGGIAKGYAAGAALSVLARLGIPSALVAASGDLVFGDPPPGKPGWRIGIDSRTLVLRNAAVSTSGDAEQHLISGGEKYSHIIDPSAGTGLTHPITVTVVARQGIDADGLATAASVLGADRGLAFIEKQSDVAALLVTGRGKTARVRESSRFKALGQPAREPSPLPVIP